MLKDVFLPKIRYACILTGLISFVITSKASPVDSSAAKAVAGNFYLQNYKLNYSSLSLVYTERSTSGEAEYYIYNVIPDNGFVIVSAEDAGYPILGYSSEGYYDPGQLSPDFVFWMKNYKKQIESIRSSKLNVTSEIQNEWNAYKNNLPVRGTKSVAGSVSPLVKTIWAQAPYYNSDCPNNDVAGCIATAMGQIMKYWDFPPHGIGSGFDSSSSFGDLYANFDTTHYNWASMPLNVTGKNSSVAILMYDCGISVKMQYTLSSSGSYMITGDNPVCAQTAFVNYFGYNGSAIQGLYMSNYSGMSWASMLENELNNNRPLMYAGSGDSGSHAWVLDGYNTTGDFHMNWGWAGYENGYYNLSALNPDELPLNSDEEALIGIEPAPAVANFGAYPTIVLAGDTVNFIDNSFGYYPITNWQWSFPGALSTSSTSQYPSIVYHTPGSYNVSETVTSSGGSNTLTVNKYINVLPNNTVNVYPTLSDGTLTIELHDPSLTSDNLQFSLYNMLGQKMYSITLLQYITQITVNVSPGMYFFRAFDTSGKPVSTGKIVIK